MKIFHYALGFPPYRTGGMTKFCMDMMLSERENGEEVGLIWPGRIIPINNRQKIKYSVFLHGIESYEIINPLPVPLDEGILVPKMYTQKGDFDIYYQFLGEEKPDIIHFHTLMGLHKELILAAKKLNIKMVFTTHDYFGICPTVTFFKEKQVCLDDGSCAECIRCNLRALSYWKIVLLQSPLYRIMKDSSVVRTLRKKHRTRIFITDTSIKNKENVSIDKKQEYVQLRKFYCELLQMIDFIHFNSTVAEQVYRKYLNVNNGKVISITHRQIRNNKKIKKFDSVHLRITYLGPARSFKGFECLIEGLDMLFELQPKSFELNIYDSRTNVSRPYMTINEKYSYSDLEKIFNKTDVLIAPSIWCETFGFTVLEALSYAVPVIVSENVGAKDLVEEGKYGWIIKPNSLEVKNMIEMLVKNRNILKSINKNIYEEFLIPSVYDLQEHIVKELYKS